MIKEEAYDTTKRREGARIILLIAFVFAAAGCQGETPPAPGTARTLQQPLAAYCTTTVSYPTGAITVDTELDYLAGVVACENGGADFNALKAQAVSARSYLYYVLARSGSIEDGTQDQVYTCNHATPTDEHRRAVAETAGEVITWDGGVIAGFYIAGAIPSTDDCVPASGDPDPTNTEHLVTYNWGKSGDDIDRFPLGHPASPQNRGAKSQNGANCLSQKGWSHTDILHFYYGADVEIVTAEGACIVPPVCEPISPAGGLIDEAGPCFERACTEIDAWYADLGVEQGPLLYTYTIDAAQPECHGQWTLNVDAAQRYEVEVYAPDIGLPLSVQATYRLRVQGGAEVNVTVSQSGADGWISLGVFELDAGADQWVLLNDNTGEPYTGPNGTRLLFDAVRLTATTEPATVLEPEPEDDLAADIGADTGALSDIGEDSDTGEGNDVAHIDASSADVTTPPPLPGINPKRADDCACQVRGHGGEGGGSSALFSLLLISWVWTRRRP